MSSNEKFVAKNLRRTILKMAYSGSTVHIPCAFSIVEIVAVLYRSFLKTTNDLEKDYLILSKGHGVMAQYACLFEMGILSSDDIENYFKDGTSLKGLSDSYVKGLDVTSGSLGHGLSIAAGVALGLKLKGSSHKVYTIVGDGESNEGSIWEALLFAAHWKLDNLIVIFDMNGYQAMGTTEEVMALGNFHSKISSFGFDTMEIDGHVEELIEQSLDQLTGKINGKPKALVANTVKGKGVSFMERQNIWHYTRLTKESYSAALDELS